MALDKLSDSELLSGIFKIVRVEKQTTLQVLEFLGEIDFRRLWLRQGYSSLFDFCVRYLKYSEGEAARRIQGSRTMKRFEEVKPVLSPMLASGEMSLTGLCLLSPHLTESNIVPLLEEARNNSTRGVEKIIETHFPELAKYMGDLIECGKQLEQNLKNFAQYLQVNPQK